MSGTNCDNVAVDVTGDLWSGCHPVPFQTMLYMENADHDRQTSPSPVITAKQMYQRHYAFDIVCPLFHLILTLQLAWLAFKQLWISIEDSTIFFVFLS